MQKKADSAGLIKDPAEQQRHIQPDGLLWPALERAFFDIMALPNLVMLFGESATRNPLGLRIQHNGTRIEALVISPRMAELHRLMPHKPPPDMSRFVLSPMPGLLVEIAVQPGQKVQAGERVAVIEAMKMENVLFATTDGVVGKVLAGKGESLVVDQPIIEFA